MSVQFPVVSKPVFIGEFGNDYRKWEVKPGRSNIRYLHEPLLKSKHVHFDLNHGFETFQSKQAEDEKLNMLLKYIMQVSDGSNLKKCIHDSEYVTWRGTMTKIGSSPYLTQDSDAWKIVCCKFQGVIFLCEMTTEIKLEKQAQESPLQKRQTYWGHKFEQYITTDRVEVRLYRLKFKTFSFLDISYYIRTSFNI
jgi:RAT1-interacting protein